MITITKNIISEWLLLDAYSEMHIAKDKLQFFERKYKNSFVEFEENLNNGNENFEKYDDYIEWKAYLSVMKAVKEKINDIRNEKNS